MDEEFDCQNDSRSNLVSGFLPLARSPRANRTRLVGQTKSSSNSSMADNKARTMTSPSMALPGLHPGAGPRLGLMCEFLVVWPLPTGPCSEGATWVYPPVGSLPAEEPVGAKCNVFWLAVEFEGLNDLRLGTSL